MATITSILLTPTSYFPLSHLLHVTLHLHVPLQLIYYYFATKNRFCTLVLLRIYIFCFVPKRLLTCAWSMIILSYYSLPKSHSAVYSKFQPSKIVQTNHSTGQTRAVFLVGKYDCAQAGNFWLQTNMKPI